MINSFNVSTATAGQIVTSTISKSGLIAAIQADRTDSYFDEESELKSVIVTYKHDAGRQKKIIMHSGIGLTGQASWSAEARDGTWQKVLVQVQDSDGAQAILGRSAIGTGEDLTKTDGTMSFNT